MALDRGERQFGGRASQPDAQQRVAQTSVPFEVDGTRSASVGGQCPGAEGEPDYPASVGLSAAPDRNRGDSLTARTARPAESVRATMPRLRLAGSP